MENMIGKEILNYRIEQELGKGGMGSVYLAINKNIDQKVAIKVLNENLAGSVVIRKKFKDEAQLLCSLDHPNIVKFLNFVENDDGVFLIMEYIDGITLEEFINSKNGLIVEKRAYEMFDQIVNAFAYAHKKGVIHRDIKPANIVLTGDTDDNFVPKVLDFGIATIVSESTETEMGWVVGTPSYMSPEQVLGVKVDARSDIYSLGVLLHQMLTGRVPYDITTLSELEINNKVVKDPLPRMKEFYPYISDKMQEMVDKAVTKEPAQRFQSCHEFRKVLKNTLNPDKTKRVIKILAVALVLLLVGGGLWYRNYTIAAYMERGTIFANKGDYKQAIENFTGVLKLAPNRYDVYTLRGRAIIASINYVDNHAEDFEKAIFSGLRSDVPKERIDDAIADFDQSIRINPNISAFYSRANAYSDKGDYDRAIADYTEAIRINPNVASSYNSRGITYSDKGDYDRAIADYTEAIKLDPKHFAAYNSRGYAYTDKGDYDRAIEDFNQAIRIEPEVASAYNNRGYAYSAKGDYDRAIADFNEALMLNPKYVSAYNNRGLAYSKKGNYDRAIEDFNQAIRIEPEVAPLYGNRGLAYYRKGQRNQAIQDLEKAIQLNPDYHWAKDWLREIRGW
ncbi:hypothetical protein AGMMS4952_09780 [Spirochaetia bacterium]|nr:hypothetical protein AGMMS4952_09780 [Spirochaetia bacterium]